MSKRLKPSYLQKRPVYQDTRYLPNRKEPSKREELITIFFFEYPHDSCLLKHSKISSPSKVSRPVYFTTLFSTTHTFSPLQYHSSLPFFSTHIFSFLLVKNGDANPNYWSIKFSTCGFLGNHSNKK